MTRKNPTPNTVKRLFGRSGNRCAFPSCNQILADNNGDLFANICHIEAAEKGGERYNPNQSDDERASFENLIILCNKHHIATDETVKYTVSILKKMKADHEAKFSQEDYDIPENVLDKALARYSSAINSSINNVESNTKEILELLKKGLEIGKLSVQPNLEDLLPNIKEILKEAEYKNFGIKFTINLDSEGNVVITVIPSPEADNFDIGTIIFPNTLRGNLGRKKFIIALENGESVLLKTDEYELKLNISLPFLPLQLSELYLGRNYTDTKIPVRLELFKDQSSSLTVNMTYMKLVRCGTKEIEIKLEGGQLIGEMKLVSNLHSNKTIFTYNGVLLSTLNPTQAKQSLSVYDALQKQSTFKIISLETEQLLLEDSGKEANSNLDQNYLDTAIKFLDILIKINRELELSLRFPESINEDLFKLALTLDNIFTNGKLTLGSGNVTFTYNKCKAIRFLQVIKDMNSSETKASRILQMPEETSFDFLEHKLLFGETNLILVNVALVKSIQEIEKEVNLLSNGEEFGVLLQYDQAIRYFPKWFSDENDEYAKLVMKSGN